MYRLVVLFQAVVSLARLVLIPQSSLAGSIWVGATSGYSTYAMSELNDLVDDINAGIYPYEMDNLSGGLSIGLQAGIGITQDLTLLASYERLMGKSEISDYSGQFLIEVPANVYKGGIEFTLPSSQRFRFAIGVLGGVLSTAGGADLRITGEGGFSSDYEGSCPVIEGYLAGVLWDPSGWISVSPQVGYRYANIDDHKANGTSLLFDLDYSGFVIRCALRMAIAQ